MYCIVYGTSHSPFVNTLLCIIAAQSLMQVSCIFWGADHTMQVKSWFPALVMKLELVGACKIVVKIVFHKSALLQVAKLFYI